MGCTTATDWKNERMKVCSHSRDFSLPHSMLYRMVKKPEPTMAKKVTTKWPNNATCTQSPNNEKDWYWRRRSEYSDWLEQYSDRLIYIMMLQAQPRRSSCIVTPSSLWQTDIERDIAHSYGVNAQTQPIDSDINIFSLQRTECGKHLAFVGCINMFTDVLSVLQKAG